MIKHEESKLKKVRVKVGDPDFEAPDGGWGWLVMIGCGISNLSTFPVYQQFGLIFQDKFNVLDVSYTEITSLLNINSAFNTIIYFFNGPFYKFFSFRQGALLGAFLSTFSIFLLIYCDSFWSLILVFGVIHGTGLGILEAANSLSVNTYFQKRRTIAMGLAGTLTGLGPIIFPYVITLSMSFYELNGTILIFTAIAMHSITCSLLYQPVHWHTNFKIISQSKVEQNLVDEEQSNVKVATPNILRETIQSFDFYLLKDPIYVKLLLGIVFGNFVEGNFASLTPFILQEFDFNKHQIATFMTVVGGCDFGFRLVLPVLAQFSGWTSKTMFLVGILLSAFGRIVLVHTKSFFVSIIVAIFMGYGSAVRSVFMSLIIPGYVAVKRLPAACGLQMTFSGIFYFIGGPLFGWIQDVFKNYVVTLHILNILIYITAIAWTFDKYNCKN